MRIDAASSQNLLASLASLNTQETSIASELSSGVRITKLSDDPVTVGNAALLADGIGRADAFIASANTANNRLQAADTALSSVVTQLTAAISSAVSAVSTSYDPNASTNSVTQLTAIRQSLLGLANSSYNGNYLFGGTSTAQPFTQAADGSVTYTGNTGTSALPLASGSTVQTSINGSSIFTASTASVFGTLNDLITNLTNGTVDSTNSATLVSALRNSLTAVTTQRVVVNTSQTQITAASSYTTNVQTSLSAQQSSLIAADYAGLATQLSATQTQRTALLSTLGIIEKGSLFDYING